jgi:hypothetical protein
VVLVSAAYVEAADNELARRVGASALVLRTPDLKGVVDALEAALERGQPGAPVATEEQVAALHGQRLQVQLERQTARNELLLRQAAIQATALSIIRGLSEVLAQPGDATEILGDVLVHCLDAAGLSTGVLYVVEHGSRHRLQAQFGLSPARKPDAEACFGHPEILDRAVAGREPVALGKDAGDSAIADFVRRVGYSSVLVVPFIVLGQGFGELLLASDTHDLTESAWIGFARALSLQFGQTVALGQSLKRLAASEGRYRALTEQANDAILIMDTEPRVLEANLRAEQLLGRPRAQILGRAYRDFVVPSESEDFERRHQDLLAAGRLRVEGRHLLRPDGDTVPVEVSAALVKLAEQPVIVAIFHDVTAQRQAAAELRAAEQRLQHVVTSSPAVLYTLKVDGDALVPSWVSSNIERLTGYGEREVTTADWWLERVHAEDLQIVTGQIAVLLAQGHITREYRFRHKDGSYRWIADQQLLVRDAEGVPEVVGSWSDVTARKQAELKLLESEEQYRLLFEANPHPMWVFDQETLAILAVNESAVRLYGYSREEFLRLTIKDVRPPEEVPLLLERLARFTDTRFADAPRTWRHRKKDGTVFEVESTGNLIVFEGRPAWLMLFTDVTEKRSLEAQLAQAQRIESLGRLAGGVAHDFNNLLGVISGYGELLRRKVAGDSRLARYATDILAATDRAAALTRQLLAFSRKQVLQPRVLDLNAVVADVEKMLRRLIGEDVQLVTGLDDRVGLVRADPGQVEQVLMNLAVNARDAMPRGGRLTIETANHDIDEAYARLHPEVAAGRYVMLAVSDTGEGMTPEVQARIFEPFFTTKEVGKGTGLGLATVHGIVRQSGGHVWVYSEVGTGTVFKVLLPRVIESVTDAAPAAAEPAAQPMGSETILVVEDEAGLRGLIRESLEESGYTVLEAGDGLAALAASQRYGGTVHLLMTDTVMPGMGGHELADRLGRERPGMAVLFTSGYTDDAVVRQAAAEGTGFLQKPFTLETLARTVRDLLDRRR